MGILRSYHFLPRLAGYLVGEVAVRVIVDSCDLIEALSGL